ncbi:hypothetical protein BW730_05300 [Tessaracoccus aquimaris]|uniref:Glycosyltransferase subfamily 4-like N-terminal domain-containing protein n=1 Tax=Tessaracoccus aquimaris TaxID=1332264 RepID=A0A1Q2CLL7_9ACTN|nr:glycosyltransferase family 4 protein [Tessaracoccus aquimaris]AQP47018.1 hypothetical protein BW730_05300 [Tessaracoccus aquimaris]
MRVALVVPYSLDQPGGVATHALGLARWLRQEGHDATVIAPGTGDADLGVPVIRLGGSVALPFNGSVAHLALSPLQARSAIEAVRGFDVVHVHEPLTPGIGYAAARRAESLVVTHHAAFAASPLVAAALRRRASSLPPRVTLAVSDAAAALVSSVTGASPDVVPNAIALPPPPTGRPAGRPVVAFLGRLNEPRKGYDTFVDIAGRVDGADFVAIGPGGSGAHGVRELGALSDAAVGEWLAAASVLVAPNRFGESFGMVLIEALSRGAAVVASDLPSFRAVADRDDVAAFFPVGDPVTAATLVARRLAAPVDAAVAWGSVARFGWDVVGPRVIDAYRRAAQMRHRTSYMS